MLQQAAQAAQAAQAPGYGIAGKMMEAMFQPGGVYTKCGVLLEDLTVDGEGQTDLFATADPKAPALLAAMDGLNSRFGRNTVILAAQGCGARPSDTKRSQKSPAWTTRIREKTRRHLTRSENAVY